MEDSWCNQQLDSAAVCCPFAGHLLAACTVCAVCSMCCCVCCVPHLLPTYTLLTTCARNPVLSSPPPCVILVILQVTLSLVPSREAFMEAVAAPSGPECIESIQRFTDSLSPLLAQVHALLVRGWRPHTPNTALHCTTCICDRQHCTLVAAHIIAHIICFAMLCCRMHVVWTTLPRCNVRCEPYSVIVWPQTQQLLLPDADVTST